MSEQIVTVVVSFPNPRISVIGVRGVPGADGPPGVGTLADQINGKTYRLVFVNGIPSGQEV